MAIKVNTGWLVTVLSALVGLLSPMVKGALADMVKNLYRMAKDSESEIDDIFVKLLADILKVDIE